MKEQGSDRREDAEREGREEEAEAAQDERLIGCRTVVIEVRSQTLAR